MCLTVRLQFGTDLGVAYVHGGAPHLPNQESHPQPRHVETRAPSSAVETYLLGSFGSTSLTQNYRKSR